MRIALFTLEYPPKYTGGLGIQVASLAQYLRKCGDHVDVYYVGEKPAPAGTIPLTCPNVNPRNNSVFDPFQIQGAEIVLKAHSQSPYDIVHIHDFHGILFACALWQRGVKVVSTTHLPATYRFYYESPFNPSESIKLSYLSLRISRTVIAVSNYTAHALLRNFRAYSNKIHIVHNGVDPELFFPEFEKRKDIILSVGRMVPQKGFKQLPNIFAEVKKRIPRVKQWIVGEGPQKKEIINGFRSLKIENAVKVIPFDHQETISEYYRFARCLAMPSIYEPFGLVAIEAMASGLPVVAYKTGGLTEIITSGDDGILVPIGDREGFSRSLVELIRDPQLCNEMGRRARSKVLKKFVQDHSNANTRDLYQ